MDGQRFDRLTRTVAAQLSRRGIVKGIGGGLAAATFAALGRGTASASNSACAHFCNAVYPPGPDRGKCKSYAAQHLPGSLCETCGADPGRVCSTGDGVATCCAVDETCNTSTGACVPPAPVCDEYADCGGGFATCCSGQCGLIVPAPCDLAIDLCCGTLAGDPSLSSCVDVSDLYPEIGSRCCIPSDGGIPCSGNGGNHCPPNGPCSICCSGLCGPADDGGNAVCVETLV